MRSRLRLRGSSSGRSGRGKGVGQDTESILVERRGHKPRLERTRRRVHPALEQGVDVRKVRINEVMTRGGKSIRPDQLAAEAVQMMEKHKITSLLVKDARGQLKGVVHMGDLLRAGVV